VPTCTGAACTYVQNTCTNTVAPSNIKTNIAKPIIGCTDATHGTYFHYTISQSGVPIYTSDAALVSTGVVVHPNTFASTGTYQVQCFYGDQTSQTFAGCPTNMVVADDVAVCDGMATYDATPGAPYSEITETNFASSQTLRFICSHSLSDFSPFGFRIGVGNILSISSETMF